MTALPGWDLLSTGAYFGYVKHPFDDEGSLDVARRMARDVGVLTIPGTFFGDGRSLLRFAFANAGRDVIAELPDRLTALWAGQVFQEGSIRSSIRQKAGHSGCRTVAPACAAPPSNCARVCRMISSGM